MNISVQNLLGKTTGSKKHHWSNSLFPILGNFREFRQKNGAFFSKSILSRRPNRLSPRRRKHSPGRRLWDICYRVHFNIASLGTIEDIEFSPSLECSIVFSFRVPLVLVFRLQNDFFRFDRILHIENKIVVVDDDRTKKKRPCTLSGLGCTFFKIYRFESCFGSSAISWDVNRTIGRYI